MNERMLKVQRWFKDNISLIAIAIISIIYVFYGLVTITETGKTPFQIVVDGAISFIMGFIIKSLFNNQGLTNGEKSPLFINTKNFYVGLLDKIAPFQHYLPKFCEMENDEMYRKAQIAILRSYSIDYDDYKNKKLEQRHVLIMKKKLTIAVGRD